MSARTMLRRWIGRGQRNAKPCDARAVARTHVGKVREINEDRFLVRSECGLWAIADGMGGYVAGGEAADCAMSELAALAEAETGQAISHRAIIGAVDRANQRIRHARSSAALMSGATIVAALLEGQRLSVYWAGDSRAYLLPRGREICCLTRDHSVVQELIDAGEVETQAADRHPFAHMVTRALGANATIELDKVTIDIAAGDRLVLCSDGISRSLEPIGLAASNGDLATLADSLIEEALRRDGSDNATVVIVDLSPLPGARSQTDQGDLEKSGQDEGRRNVR